MPPSARIHSRGGRTAAIFLMLFGVMAIAALLFFVAGCDKESPNEVRIDGGVETEDALSRRAADSAETATPPEGHETGFDPAIDPKRIPMSSIPAGSFTMGDGVAPCGYSEREVTLTRDFLLGRTEVTNKQYRNLLQWAYNEGYVTATSGSVKDNMDGSTVELLDLNDFDCPISFDSGRFTIDAGKRKHPVVEVTWYGAAAFCDWLSMREGLARAYDHSDWSCNGGDPYGAEGYRLPTDAEWEYAARYDDERVYPWGDDPPTCDLANCFAGTFCVGTPSPVGDYPAAPTALGLFDMAGNVWEWCNDWFACDLGTDPATDPAGPDDASLKVLRGGGWSDWDINLRSACRNLDDPPNSSANVGFRVARTD